MTSKLFARYILETSEELAGHFVHIIPFCCDKKIHFTAFKCIMDRGCHDNISNKCAAAVTMLCTTDKTTFKRAQAALRIIYIYMERVRNARNIIRSHAVTTGRTIRAKRI